MQTERFEYEADGLQMVGHLAFSENNKKRGPGVLVFPEVFGLGQHAKNRAERLASEFGYTALACDFFGGGELHSSMQEALEKIAPVRQDPAKMRARGEGALKALAARSEVDAKQVAAIGFCFGGTMALELARSGAELAAVVGFHSGLATSRP